MKCFDQAATELDGFLQQIGWPREVIWVNSRHFLVMPPVIVGNDTGRLLLFRPPCEPNLNYARHHFAIAQEAGTLVRMYALARNDDKTYASLESIDEPGQGEGGFFDGVKIMSSANPPEVKAIKSRLGWWLLTRLQSRWERQHDRAIEAA